MVFYEFKTNNDPSTRYYFVGTSYGIILDNTYNGTGFGNLTFTQCREVTKEEIYRMNFLSHQIAVNAVYDGCPIVLLGFV